MLPFGLRVQEKIERLIDKHMRSFGRFMHSSIYMDSIDYGQAHLRFHCRLFLLKNFGKSLVD